MAIAGKINRMHEDVTYGKYTAQVLRRARRTQQVYSLDHRGFTVPQGGYDSWQGR